MTRAKGRREMTDTAKSDTTEVEFFNVFDGTKGRSDSVYLDMEEREYAEKNRARAEGREPETDFGKLPPTAGTPLVVKAQLVDNSWTSNPSILAQDHGNGVGAGRDVDPVSVGTVDLSTDTTVTEQVPAVESKESRVVTPAPASSPDPKGSENPTTLKTTTKSNG